MTKPKNLVVAIFFASLILIFNMRFALAESDKMYFEFGASIGSGGEADAKFTDDNTTASWDIGDLVGAKLQVGWDLGKVRADVKARLMQGDVDAISGGVTSVNNIGSRSGPDVILGLATVNAYLDIADMKISEETSLHLMLVPVLVMHEGLCKPMEFWQELIGKIIGVRPVRQ